MGQNVQQLVVQIVGDVGDLKAKLGDGSTALDGFRAKVAGLGSTGAATGISLSSLAASAGVALLAIGARAEQMAVQVDAALRQIGASSPELRESLGGVGKDIDAVSVSTGRSRDEIFQASQDISRLGVATEAEFKNKLNAATLIADATGTQLSSAVEGVDELTDAFNTSTDDIVASVAKIYSASKGRVDFDSIFGALRASIPQIQKMGIDFNTAVNATVALLDRGFTSKKVGAFFNEHDADGIRQVAAEATIAAGALDELNDAASFRRNGADRQMQRVWNEFNASMADLGKNILPIVSQGLEGISIAIATVTKGMDGLRQPEFLSTALTLGANASVIAPGSDQYTHLAEAIGKLNAAAETGKLDLDGVSTTQIKQLREAFDAYQKLYQATWGSAASLAPRYKPLLDVLDAAIAKQKTLNTGTGAAGAGGSAGGSEKRKALPLTIAQQQAQSQVRQEFDQATAALTPGKADDLAVTISKLTDAAKKAGLGADEIATRTASLTDAAKKSSQVQAKSLEAEIQVALASFSAGASDSFLAANQRLVEGMQKKLDMNTLLSKSDRQAQQAEIDLVAAKGISAAATLKLFDALSQADTAAAASQKQYADQTADLTQEESQLNAVIQLSTTSTGDREAAEASLRDVQQKRLALSIEQANADRDQIARINSQIDALLKQASSETTSGKDQEEIKKKILDYEQQIKDLQAQVNALGGTAVTIAQQEAEARARSVQHLTQMANLITGSVEGALELAGAFNLMSQSSVHTLQNLGQIANQMPALVDQIRLIGQTDDAGNSKTNAASVIGAALPVLGSVVSLVSSIESSGKAQQQALAKAFHDNTIAITNLTAVAKLGGFGGQSGNTANSDLALVQSILAMPAQDQGKALGTNSTELAAASARLGITFTNTQEGLLQLEQALEKGIPLLGKFGTGIDSALSEIDAESKIYGDTGPGGDLAKVFSHVGSLSSGIAEIFKDIDLSQTLTPDEIDKIRQRVKDLFAAMEGGGLTADQLGDLNGQDFLQILEQIITDLNGVSDAAAAAAPAIKSLSEQLTDVQTAASNQISIYDIKDPAAIFQTKAKADAAQIGGSLGDLLKSFNLDDTSPENIASINTQLQAFFQKLQDSPDSVDMAGLSVDDLINVLLDLHGAADSVAAGIQSAADKMNAARASLDTDFQIFNETDPTKLGVDVAGFYSSVDDRIKGVLDGLDLTTDAGRAAADQALQGLYSANKGDDQLTKEILDILQHIRAVPAAVAGSVSGIAATAGSSGTTSGSAYTAPTEVQTITVQQATLIDDTLVAILAELRDYLPGIGDIRDLLRSLAPVLVTAPQIPSQYLAGSGGGDVYLTMTITQQFYGNVGTIDRSAANDFAQYVLDDIDKGMGARFKNAKRLRGDVTQR